MGFNLDKILDELETTPFILKDLVSNLPDSLVKANVGPESWSTYDIVGHLIHGEKTDWLPRVRNILSSRNKGPFMTFDRFAQFENSIGKSIDDMLQEFQIVRVYNIRAIEMMDLGDDDFIKEGLHPELGKVTLKQLFYTWTTHDKAHMSQIYRVLAYQYKSELGPWKDYFKILKEE